MTQLAASSAEPVPPATLVRCRSRSGWLLAFLLALLGSISCLPAFLPRNGNCQCTPEQLQNDLVMTRLFGGIGIALLCCGLWAALWAVRGAVIGDNEGLRWRGVGRWRRVWWDEVTDYYREVMPTGRLVPVVVTPAGKLRLTSLIANTVALSELIQVKAMAAKARDWETEGTRDVDTGEYEFHYNTGDIKFLTFITWIFWPAIAFWVVYCIAPKFNLLEALHRSDWGWTVAGLAILAVFVLAKSSIVLLLIPLLRDTRRRKGQRIIVTQAGIRFIDGEVEIDAPWSEVTDYRAEASGPVQVARHYIVETKAGRFDVRHTVSRFALLKTLIEHYVPTHHSAEWNSDETVPIGGESATWSGGSPGAGDRIFHYRTRAVRAMLALPISFNVILLLMPILRVAPDPDAPPDVGTTIVMNLIYLGVTIVCLRLYYRLQVEISDAGIAARGCFRRRFIAWADVNDYGQYPGSSSYYTVTGAGQRISFTSGVVNLKDLLREIERRAVGCKVHTWERD